MGNSTELERENLEVVGDFESEKVAEKEKTSEEKRQENIDRLTQKARLFIDEKKQAVKMKEAQDKMEELKSREAEKEIEYQDKDIPVKVGIERPKKGFMESIKDKFILRKFQKAGIEDPQKALRLCEYMKGMNPYFDIRKHVVDFNAVEKLLETFEDPIVFLDSLRSIFKFNLTDLIYENSWNLMKDPNIFKKIDLFKSIVEIMAIACDYRNISYRDFSGFLKNEELQSRLSLEKLNKIKELIFLGKIKIFSIDDLSKFLDIVEDEDIFKIAFEILKENAKYEEHAVFYIEDLISKIQMVKKNNLTEKVLMAGKMNVSVNNMVLLLARAEENKQKQDIEDFESLEIKELFSDNEFKKFTDDFSSIAGRNFSLREFESLHRLYKYNGKHALAFFEVLKDLGILKESERGSFDIEKIEDTIGRLRQSSLSSPEVFYSILEPDFKEKFDWYRSIDKNFNDDDLLRFAFMLRDDKDFLDSLETENGKELFEFFRSKGENPFFQRDFFKYSSSLKILKKIDRFVEIGNNFNLTPILDLCREEKEEEISLVVNFLEESNIGGEKISPYDIALAQKFYKIKDSDKLKYYKKYFNFFFDYRIFDFFESDPQRATDLFALIDAGQLNEGDLIPNGFLRNNIEKIFSVPQEKRVIYIKLSHKINQSPSQEIQRIKNELINQLLEVENPEEIYARIEEIFIKNNLPPVGKIFKIFSIINSPQAMDLLLKRNENLSPCLGEASQRRRYFTIYKDLINIHVQSGNRSFRDYLKIVTEGQDVFNKIENEGVEKLDEEEQKHAEMLLKKMKTLWENSRQGMKMNSADIDIENGIESTYQEIKESIGAKEGQTIADRVSQMFLAPAGYGSIDQVLAEMRESRDMASERGKEVARLLQLDRFNLQNGDIIKGVPSNRLESILQGGAVAREFLGSESGSDSTPYDSDVLKITKAESSESFSQNVKKYFSIGYGDINIIVKNRGQFSETSKDDSKSYDPSKLELFKTGVVSGEHYGIRTGIPSSEIDLMVVPDNFVSDERKKTNIFFEIAKNGFYIPVADTEGNLLFSPEQYEEYLQFFNGLEDYNGSHIEFEPTKNGDKNYSEVSQMMRELPQDREHVEELKSKVRNIINDILEKNNIKLKDKWETSIIGAELMDTGSTDRHTNAPNNYDFDLVLRLDDADMGKIPKVAGELRDIFKPEKEESHSDGDNGYQLRAKKAVGIDGNPIDIDVAFVRKSQLVQFGSHDAVEEKLDWIKNNVGQEAYEQTVANIVLAKKVLKEGGAYKKFEHGGFGGIGVENWILANGGNMLKAFESFSRAAHGENGEVLSLDDFRKKYKILDPGVNMKFNSHDNFISVLKETGYQAMLKTIEAYIAVD